MPIPNNAKKVFEGILFDAYHWEQEQFDGSTATFEMLKRKNSVGILPIVGDKILVIREEQPHSKERYALVGGQQDKGETALDAAKREMQEEIGYSAEKWELWKERSIDSRIEWTISTFIARDCKKTSEPHLDPGERIQPLLVTFDEFMEIILDPEFRSKDVTLDILTFYYHGKLDEFKKMLFQ